MTYLAATATTTTATHTATHTAMIGVPTPTPHQPRPRLPFGLPDLSEFAARVPAAAYGWLILAATAGLLLYALLCAAAPFGNCRRCHGEGKMPSRFGRGRRWCRRCEATGLRLRYGRRAWNYTRRLYRDIAR